MQRFRSSQALSLPQTFLDGKDRKPATFDTDMTNVQPVSTLLNSSIQCGDGPRAPGGFLQEDKTAGCHPCLFCSAKQHSAGGGAALIGNSDPQDDLRQRRELLKTTDGDLLQAKDLESLTAEERAKVYDDVHGVADAVPVPTDPDILQSYLDAMEEKLRNTRMKKPYDLAMFLFPRYSKSGNLRLVFLRAVDFDPARAAKRLILFFTIKLKLFGASMLGREIMLTDLSEPCQQVVRSGCFQLFPHALRDRSGRPIFVQMSHLFGQHKPDHIVRTFFYSIMAGLREMSDADQCKGVVGILHSIGIKETSPMFWELLSKGIETAKALPIKQSACHLCYDSLMLKPAVSLVQVSVSKYARMRIRSFAGSFLESMYHLNTFGIPTDSLSLHHDGTLDRTRYDLLIQSRLHNESNYNHILMEVPTSNDVLLGRGKSYQTHPGNVKFLKIVEHHGSQYMNADKATKKRIVEEIRNAIDHQGGRFMRLSNDALDWELMNRSESGRKIRNAFRFK